MTSGPPHYEAASRAPRPVPRSVLPTLAEGAELVGEFKGSGYRESPHLVRLPNQQLVRLPELLYLVVKALHDHRLLPHEFPDPWKLLRKVSDAVSHEVGARLTIEQIIFLIDQKLAPLGVTTYSDGAPPPEVKADPFLGLRFKMAVLPESATWRVGGVFAWLFRPPVAATVVGAAVISEIWLFTTQPLAAAMQQTLLTPAMILVILGLVLVSSAFHEIGHASACRYGGVRPGVMGCGIYLVWPAFYTDVTESYRLGRVGRLRTDLGGVYFNGIFVLALTALYLLTGFQPLLVGILAVNLEILQQLLPTLRFDGYYIVSDIVGIPDLFKYIGPILKRTILRRPTDDRLRALKRWPQVVITIWVLIVIPVLAFQLSIMALQVPAFIVKDWYMIKELARAAGSGASPLYMIASGLQILMLALPVLGLVLLSYQMIRKLVTTTTRYIQGPTAATADPS